MLISAPLWALIAAAIKLDTRGPVFYGQARVGEGGRIFRVLKFRSMIDDAEKDIGPMPAGEDDPRVTRVGRVLRATAMDELPQLWNIFRGDMSFVGPRALRPEEIDVDTAGRPVPLQAIPGFAARSADPARPDRDRANLRAPRRVAPAEVPLRSALRPPAVDAARPPADSSVVLDHRARHLGSAGEEILNLT